MMAYDPNKTIRIKEVGNGYIIERSFHYKPSAKDPGHNRTDTYVAYSSDIHDILATILKMPWEVVVTDE